MRFSLLILFVLFSLSCQKISADSSSEASSSAAKSAQGATSKNSVLAVIGDTSITLGEFEHQINKQSPYVRVRYKTVEQRKEFLNNMIRFEVLAQEAKKNGLDKNPDVVRAMKQVMVQKLMKKKFQKTFAPEDITDKQIEDHYNNHLDDYHQPEKVRVSAIIVKGAKTANEVAQMAKGEKGATNKNFRRLVDIYSADEKTKMRGGDLRYFSKDNKDLPKEVVNASFQMATLGEVKGPVKAGKNLYYILKQTGHQNATQRKLEGVKKKIQNKLFRQLRNKSQSTFINELRKNAKIEIFESELKKAKVDTTPPPK